MKTSKTIIIACFLLSSYTSKAQEKITKKPKRAAIYSAIIPGAGQIYTEKYWKVPIIYAGLITSAYYINESNNLYLSYKNSYLDRLEGNSIDPVYEEYSDSQLITLTNHHKRNREISTFCFIGIYLINIIDASVNAHLFNYDVSEDLSINIQPTFFSQSNTTGILLSFNL